MFDYPSRPSRGLPRNFRFGIPADQLRLPCRNVIEIIGLNHAVGQYVDRPHDVGIRRLGVARPFDHADETLRDANLVRYPLLGFSRRSSPVSKLHRSSSRAWVRGGTRCGPFNNMTRYCGLSYYVNGHDEIAGTKYDAMAYVYVMHPGTRLRELRKAAKLSQGDLGTRAGMAQETISLYENGHRPIRLDDMRVLARELGCSVADILSDEDNPDRLDEAERELLEAFRRMPPDGRSFLTASAQAVAEKAAEYAPPRRAA